MNFQKVVQNEIRNTFNFKVSIDILDGFQHDQEFFF